MPQWSVYLHSNEHRLVYLVLGLMSVPLLIGAAVEPRLRGPSLLLGVGGAGGLLLLLALTCDVLGPSAEVSEAGVWATPRWRHPGKGFGWGEVQSWSVRYVEERNHDDAGREYVQARYPVAVVRTAGHVVNVYGHHQPLWDRFVLLAQDHAPGKGPVQPDAAPVEPGAATNCGGM